MDKNNQVKLCTILPIKAYETVVQDTLQIKNTLALYDCKSDPQAKLRPRPHYVCKTAKVIPNWSKLTPHIENTEWFTAGL